ncbi:hypothetical protein GBAR_LOCUS18403 [Geodia barretti]|uniref:Uncharacterized protein n=1 Tax=Geodia barretti TaxID=519541 RepID=A0AA35SM01_GEOBA|nr:hypothetical protein GBAR_LOCUS18403 [Geodia barretti]
MVLLAVLFAVVLGLHGVLAKDDCVRSIRDYDEQDYQVLAADPWKIVWILHLYTAMWRHCHFCRGSRALSQTRQC